MSYLSGKELEGRRPWLNLGCGNRYNEQWINIDVQARPPHVIGHDLATGIPLPNESCEVAYHSSFLEHLRRHEAEILTKECFRVLKPNGVLRVATPDLERICQLYLEKLEDVRNGKKTSELDYEWILLEMYDQAVRESNGGAMLEYLRRDPLQNEKFVLERIGEEGRELRLSLRGTAIPEAGISVKVRAAENTSWFSCFRRRLKRRLLRCLIGVEGLKALDVGVFRASGEIHHWMYDSFSLSNLLQEAGFQEVVVRSAFVSKIDNWREQRLDCLPNGAVVKPDSLFVEGIKK